MLTVGDPLPSFELSAVAAGAPQSSFAKISNTSAPDKWQVLFFWPKDFTFVCPTEIAAFGGLQREFAERDGVWLR